MSTGRVRRFRLVVMIPGGMGLLAGLWAGLLLLGLDLPRPRPNLAALHGPLLVSGFLGVLISIERAVALRRRWPYVAPIAAGAGTVLLLAGAPMRLGQSLLVVASVTLVLVSGLLVGRQPEAHHVIMALGAASWATGCALWLSGRTVWQTVPFLAGFLVLTIVGERRELSRVARPSAAARGVLIASVAVFAAGLVTGLFSSVWGYRVGGLGLVAQALWLLRYDVARRTVRTTGLTRYMAVAILLGSVWLVVGGVTWMSSSGLGGRATDVGLHAIFLGFVFSMIFAHAPVILPAVTGLRLPYRPILYLPLMFLHVALVVRFAGAAIEHHRLWRVGGMGTEAAVALFVLAAFVAAASSRRVRSGPDADGVRSADLRTGT